MEGHRPGGPYRVRAAFVLGPCGRPVGSQGGVYLAIRDHRAPHRLVGRPKPAAFVLRSPCQPAPSRPRRLPEPHGPAPSATRTSAVRPSAARRPGSIVRTHITVRRALPGPTSGLW
uniref:Uncharacterized protein n=1 Tax=Streptomyces sp. F2 TaxID=317660 RepID=V9Z676_9ACTN|nr:hypothetical protein pFRL4_385 [Streptomyces sp. F2]